MWNKNFDTLILKTISYRIIASLATFIIVLTSTGKLGFGIAFSMIELIFKPILYFTHEIMWDNLKKKNSKNTYDVSKDLTSETSFIKKEEREKNLNQRGITIWFTGLSGSGKSTIAKHLERHLFEKGLKTYILDGDNTRLNINKDLGFSLDDRKENIRRVAEISKLFNEAGIMTLCCFISPTNEIRELAKNIIGKENFKLIYLQSSLETCIERDIKGLYKKAIEKNIPNFTGISSPFEIPENLDLILDTELELEMCLLQIHKWTKNNLLKI